MNELAWQNTIQRPSGNGNSGQLLKPMIFGSDLLPSGSLVDTSIDIHFDGLLVVKEELSGGGFSTEARVEYSAEIQWIDPVTGIRDIFGDNTFEGVAWLTDDGTTCTVNVPETYEWMEGEEASPNGWYNNPGLQLVRVVEGVAGPGEISIDQLPPDTQAEAAAQVAAGRQVYYVVYDERFSFQATVGDTYFMAMNLLTAAGSFGDSHSPSYALSDFSNTITYRFSGTGLDLRTVVIISGNESINSDDPVGGSSTTLVLSGGNLIWAGNYNLTSAIQFEAGSTNIFHVGAFDAVLSGALSGSGSLQKLDSRGKGARKWDGPSRAGRGSAHLSARNRPNNEPVPGL